MTASAGAVWQRVGNPPPNDLIDARLQMHWASQIVASVGITFLTPRPDDSHPNMEWLASRSVLAGNPTEEGDPPLRAGLDPFTFALLMLDEEGATLDRYPLHTRTLNEAYAWLTSIFPARRGPSGSDGVELTRPTYELPPHPVADGASFDAVDLAAFRELGRWYANADYMLRRFADAESHATTVRVWPHHFDIGGLFLIDGVGDSHADRSIGLGMTPGDASYPEPYWYVNPYPAPSDDRVLPALSGGGVWHSEGWLGAVLTGSTYLDDADVPAQEKRTEIFLRSAIDACRSVLPT